MKKKASWTSADLIIPIFALSLSIYYISTIWNVPQLAQWYGGGLSLINIVFFAVALFCAAKSGAFKKKANLFAYLKSGQYKTDGKGNAVALILMVAVYIALLPVLGYFVCSFVFICGVMYFLKIRRMSRIFKCALCISLLGFFLFVIVLNVPIPLDPVSEKIRLFFFSLSS